MKYLPLYLLLFLSNPGIAQIIPLLKGLDKGEYEVGLKSASVMLNSASDPSDVQMHYLHWYPSVQKDKDRFTYRRYVTLFEEDAESAIQEFLKTPQRYGASDAMLTKILSGETLASYGVTQAEQSKELIVCIAGAGAYSYSNAFMCEILASYGYDVLGIEFESDELGALISAGLIESAISRFETEAGREFESVGIMAHGRASTSALLFALQSSSTPIRAFVGLDPHFLGNAGLDEIKDLDLSGIPDFQPAAFIAASGYWNKTRGRVSDLNNAIYDAMPPEASHMVFMEQMLHHSFVSDMHIRLDNSGVDFSEHGVEQNQKQVDRSYRLLTELILAFFDSSFTSSDGFNSALQEKTSKHPELVRLID